MTNIEHFFENKDKTNYLTNRIKVKRLLVLFNIFINKFIFRFFIYSVLVFKLCLQYGFKVFWQVICLNSGNIDTQSL